MVKGNTPCVKPTILGALDYSVTSAAAHFEDLTSPPSTENIMSTTFPAACAQLYSERKTAITNTTAMFTAISIIQHGSRKDATAAKLLFSNSLLKSSAMDKTSTGTPSAT